MSDERIAPEAITVAEAVIKRSGYAVPSRDVLEAAIRAADDARKLRVEYGWAANGTNEAFVALRERREAVGSAYHLVMRPVGDWRPVERPS